MNKKETKRILLLAANPIDTHRIRFDEEIHDIVEGIRRSKYRERFNIKSAVALRYKDLRRVLLDYEPQFVHFIGHGDHEGLKLEDEDGHAINIPVQKLTDLFSLCAKHVECVILNACYTNPQAQAINDHIPYVIGMRDKIPDIAAIEFSIGFYDALGAGKSIEEAFNFGKNAIMCVMPDFPVHYIPSLKIRLRRPGGSS